MKYGYFDDKKREYVIQRPDTPAPWVNYLGSPKYGAIISNNAGGYSFAKSGANGRILRYIFNSFDQPGRYLYIRDNDSEDYWSASWQPVGKDPDRYRSECRHGMGYTHMIADYSEIPQGVLSGNLGNVTSYNENSCGALSCTVTLAPGETKTIAFLLGTGGMKEASILQDYTDPVKKTASDLSALKSYWYEKLDHLRVTSPSQEFNTMLGTWNAYNCFMTFIWSRAASFIYCGLRNGYGYRDTVQDIQGIIHLAPEMAKEKIRFMLSAQVKEGGGLPLVKFTHNPGHEDTPDDASYREETGHPAYRADDALWLFPTVYKYIAETGDTEFLDEVIPFADAEADSVYGHLKRAVSFSLGHLGPHGMPAGLYADWNDCLRLGEKGESSFVAMQFYYALVILKRFSEYREDADYTKYLEGKIAETGALIQKLCWDNDRFIRGYTEAGERIGAAADPEASLWLNPQSWSVISGLADSRQADAALTNVYENLNTEYGALLMDPPYHSHAFDGALAVIYNQGTKENSGIFSQSQGWLILAEALCGHGEHAFTYFMENAPAAWNDKAEIRRLEPYCYGQFTEGRSSRHPGRSHVHWLTGTASTVMVGCVEGILGLRPDLKGIKIAPAIPKQWERLEIEKDFRGKHLHILIKNPDKKESGCQALTVNGRKLEENYIPADLLKEDNEILLIL